MHFIPHHLACLSIIKKREEWRHIPGRNRDHGELHLWASPASTSIVFFSSQPLLRKVSAAGSAPHQVEGEETVGKQTWRRGKVERVMKRDKMKVRRRARHEAHKHSFPQFVWNSCFSGTVDTRLENTIVSRVYSKVSVSSRALWRAQSVQARALAKGGHSEMEKLIEIFIEFFFKGFLNLLLNHRPRTDLLICVLFHSSCRLDGV